MTDTDALDEAPDEAPAPKPVRAYLSTENARELIRERRLALGLSQIVLAERANVSRKWLGDFECGRHPQAGMDIVLDVLQVLGVHIEFVIEDPPQVA